MIRLLGGLTLLALLSACTPADESYCASFGVQGTSEYGRCLDYYHAQQKAFDTDRSICESAADETYPPTLYDRGGYAPVTGSFWAGHYYPGGMVQVQPDYYRNAEVDRLRMRIIAPCMTARGWNSPNSWQAGQHPIKTAPEKNRNRGALPWKTR